MSETDWLPNEEKPYYVVLERFEIRGSKYVTLIMILREQRKAELLAAFLNSGNYFETPVTVEAFNGNATPNQIKDRIAAEI
jgi:hypothetical protein